jgi:4-hydroxybenzoate polyprenyltransferase
MFLGNALFTVIVLLFIVINLGYTFRLKHYVMVDVIVISILFVLRAIAGAVVIHVSVSPWLVMCAFLLALFMALGKRQREMILLGDKAGSHRSILTEYSDGTLNQMISIITATLIMSYSMYTFLATNQYMMMTIPIAVYGIFRYLYLIERRGSDEESDLVFKDKPIIAAMILWILVIVAILYGIPDIVGGWI